MEGVEKKDEEEEVEETEEVRRKPFSYTSVKNCID